MTSNDGSTESRRILDRVAREADGSMMARAARRARDHVAAADAPENDAVELWGTRIGRVLGLVVTLALLGWFASFLMAG